MSHLFYLLPALACPVGMGAMMWLMMRGGKTTSDTPPRSDGLGPVADQQGELAQLRAEVDQLRRQVSEAARFSKVG